MDGAYARRDGLLPRDCERYTTISCRTIITCTRIASRYEAMLDRTGNKLKNKPGGSVR